MTFFDILSNILTKNNDELESNIDFDSTFSSYMLVRYLSMRDTLLPYAKLIQLFIRASIDEKTIYKWAYANIPRQSSPYIKYITKPKKGKNG